VPIAGARPADQGDLGDADFAAFATALELAAVAAYTAAFDKDVLDDVWADRALQFQSHHQAVADTLVTLGAESAAAPVAEAAFAKRSIDAIDAATDQNGVLAALAVVEETLAATHLAGIGQSDREVHGPDRHPGARRRGPAGRPPRRRQRLVRSPQVTPATNSGDAALTIPKGGAEATTTTTAAAGTSSDDSKTNSSTPETDADTKTSAPSAND
jgi:hypothetical protein